MIIRVQSSKGTKRIEVGEKDSVAKFAEKVRLEFNIGIDEHWSISRNRDGSDKLKVSKTLNLQGIKIKHGDMVYLTGEAFTVKPSLNGTVASRGEPMDVDNGDLDVDSYTKPKYSPSRTPTNMSTPQPSLTPSAVVEDPIDLLLDKMDGRIERKRNEQLCRHGPIGKCIHCVPLEPYDEDYLEHCDPPIKFMSFHAYVRKLCGGSDKGKFVFLENISCRIKSGCKEHLPWPEGICTKCQPNAVTLSTQKYRHVDYIQFENASLMESFLNYWRKTGNQRIGFLYGRYAHFENVPLGIKAVVSAIYEPPQESTSRSVKLLTVENDSIEKEVERVASELGLQCVGWIFTDLVAEDLQKGTVKHYRGTMDTFFLSAQECITAANLQNKYTSPCKLSSEGNFGSKFVTVVVTGDATNQIHFEGYQVSNQCMALVKDNCLVPTYDAPELGYIRESTNEQYVPDVFYAMKDKYNNEVTKLGRPLPVEYLLVDMPAAFPVQEEYTVAYSKDVRRIFPIEHRQSCGEIQDFSLFARHLKQFPPSRFLEAVSDFHLLLFLATCDMLPVRNRISELCTAVRTKDGDAADRFAQSEEWQTVLQLMEHTNEMVPKYEDSLIPRTDIGGVPMGPVAESGAGAGVSSAWNCAHCTYLNRAGAESCEICGLPS